VKDPKMRFLAFFVASVIIAAVQSDDPKRCATDMVFIVDQSSSITPINYKTKILPFLVNLTQLMSIDSNGDHVAFIPFSDPEVTNVAFPLNKHLTREELIQAIERHQFQGGNTATKRALELARGSVFLASNGARRTEYKETIAPTALIITDGIATDGEPGLAAEDLRQDGVTIFAVGVGSLVNEDYLKQLTGDKGRIFPVTDYKDLDIKLAQAIIDSTSECVHRSGVFRKA